MRRVKLWSTTASFIEGPVLLTGAIGYRTNVFDTSQLAHPAYIVRRLGVTDLRPRHLYRTPV
ncbi:MAG: hypothetical protein U0K19_03735 [Bifidobacteriaceae bacterium]|nr:hypothetical protein [Bifidobacteriaceae bacterium]